MIRLPSRVALAAALASIGALAAPVGASAAVTPVKFGNTLTITSNSAGDTITLAAAEGVITVNGTSTGLAADDNAVVVVNAGPGRDTVNAVLLAATSYKSLTVKGGPGADTLLGGGDDDVLIGDSGKDKVDGNRGTDVALLGSGADSFTWDPGDGNDAVEGQGGSDVLDFNGANISEKVDVSANGSRVRFFRDVANVTMDLDGIERVDFDALGGADTVAVNDMTGTDLEIADIDLGGADAQPDTVNVNGTNVRDRVRVTRYGTQVRTTGLAAQTRITGSEAANDTLLVSTLGGNDDVRVARNVTDLIRPVIDLGAGE